MNVRTLVHFNEDCFTTLLAGNTTEKVSAHLVSFHAFDAKEFIAYPMYIQAITLCHGELLSRQIPHFEEWSTANFWGGTHATFLDKPPATILEPMATSNLALASAWPIGAT